MFLKSQILVLKHQRKVILDRSKMVSRRKNAFDSLANNIPRICSHVTSADMLHRNIVHEGRDNLHSVSGLGEECGDSVLTQPHECTWHAHKSCMKDIVKKEMTISTCGNAHSADCDAGGLA